METLLNKIASNVEKQRVEDFKRYTEIILQQSDDDVAAAELATLMPRLGLTVEKVQKHIETVAEVRRLAPLAAEVGARSAAANEARGDYRERQKDIESRRKALDDEERDARQMSLAADDRHVKAREAADRIKAIGADLPWAVEDADRPRVPNPVLLGENFPRWIDGRLLTLNPTDIISRNDLLAMGMPAIGLKPGYLPSMQDGSLFTGAVIREWSTQVHKEIRRRRREYLRSRLVAISDDAPTKVEPGRWYDRTQLSMVAPVLPELLRTKTFTVPSKGDTYDGGEIHNWAVRTLAANAEIRRELAQMQAEETLATFTPPSATEIEEKAILSPSEINALQAAPAAQPVAQSGDTFSDPADLPLPAEPTEQQSTAAAERSTPSKPAGRGRPRRQS